jgi:hypothetical protein
MADGKETMARPNTIVEQVDAPIARLHCRWVQHLL